MTLLITLTVADIDTGPFNLYANGDIFPFAELIEKSVLLAGYTSTVVPDGTTSINVQSVNELCNNFITLTVDATTSTTTSTSTSSTTSTSTSSTTTTTTTAIPTILICNQEWTLRNLEVTTYRNGDTIPQSTNQADWIDKAENGIGAWCYNEFNTANGPIYGKLYNWYAVNDTAHDGLAPLGYHVPTVAEWTILTNNCLGGEGVAGGKMKSTGTIQAGTGLWITPNTGATNSSGFTGLPGGSGSSIGYFGDGLGATGMWWSSSEYNEFQAFHRYIIYDTDNVTNYRSNKGGALSVRLIKD